MAVLDGSSQRLLFFFPLAVPPFGGSRQSPECAVGRVRGHILEAQGGDREQKGGGRGVRVGYTRAVVEDCLRQSTPPGGHRWLARLPAGTLGRFYLLPKPRDLWRYYLSSIGCQTHVYNIGGEREGRRGREADAARPATERAVGTVPYCDSGCLAGALEDFPAGVLPSDGSIGIRSVPRGGSGSLSSPTADATPASRLPPSSSGRGVRGACVANSGGYPSSFLPPPGHPPGAHSHGVTVATGGRP